MQKYHIPHSLAKKILQKNRMGERNALRLWYWMKVHGYYTHLNIKQLPPELLQNFTKKTVKNYLATLLKNGWVGQCPRTKTYFLRGRTFVFKQIDRKSKCLAHPVSPENVATKQAWEGFLGACINAQIVRRISRASKAEAVTASTPESGGQAAWSQGERPVSCEYLSETLGVSIATASRIRRRAAGAGLISNRRSFVDMSGMFPNVNRWDQLLHLRGELAEALPSVWRQRRDFMTSNLPLDSWPDHIINPNALRLIDGKVWMQLPNQVANIQIGFKCLSKGKASKSKN